MLAYLFVVSLASSGGGRLRYAIIGLCQESACTDSFAIRFKSDGMLLPYSSSWLEHRRPVIENTPEFMASALKLYMSVYPVAESPVVYEFFAISGLVVSYLFREDGEAVLEGLSHKSKIRKLFHVRKTHVSLDLARDYWKKQEFYGFANRIIKRSLHWATFILCLWLTISLSRSRKIESETKRNDHYLYSNIFSHIALLLILTISLPNFRSSLYTGDFSRFERPLDFMIPILAISILFDLGMVVFGKKNNTSQGSS